MKKVEKGSSAGTTAEQSTKADVKQVSQPIAKPHVRCRADINNDITQKWELIQQLKSEILKLEKEDILLCDEHQRFEEKYEDVIISKRPKKIESKLIGRIYWTEEFKDEDTNQSVFIDRSQIVRVNGVWK